MKRLKDNIQNVLLLLVSLIICIIAAEVFLRFYNPFEFSVKGEKIILRAYKKNSILTAYSNFYNNKLDAKIIHTKNSIGFRGVDPPKNLEKYLSIIAIGGSTTECLLLSDGKDWPAVLYNISKKDIPLVWINNAGIDGHSAYGHTILMEDYIIKIRPKMVLFLVGINDIGLEKINSHDEKTMIKGMSFANIRSFLKSIEDHSEILSFGQNIDRCRRAKARQLSHHQVDVEKLGYTNLEERSISEKKLLDESKFLIPFEKRLENIIRISRAANIIPVFITQPVLYGYGVDPVTGVDLEKIKMADGFSGSLNWKILELYNQETRYVGKKNNVLVIDLATKMPKSSDLYYDLMHFTNKGAETVANIIFNDLNPYIKKYFPQYIRS
jgi:lysophospholipase L1-like esterase